jgi:3-hydroxy-3-methylglutaryl CoA synthase
VGGERAVANYDEDSLTMSCEAALNALHGRDIRSIGACFLASTSAPYAEKSSAAILATVADLSPAVLTADLGGSLRCGTTALRLALDTVKAGSAAEALVAAGDVRPVTGRARHSSAAATSSQASRAPSPRATTSPMCGGFRATAT